MGEGDEAPDLNDGSDRREETRHFACFPAHIQREGGSPRTALIKDLSVTGALLLTRASLAVGDAVHLNLYLSELAVDPRVAAARVVRVEKRRSERAEVWPFSVGVQFDVPLRDCEADIKEIEARQAALGLPRD